MKRILTILAVVCIVVAFLFGQWAVIQQHLEEPDSFTWPGFLLAETVIFGLLGTFIAMAADFADDEDD